MLFRFLFFAFIQLTFNSSSSDQWCCIHAPGSSGLCMFMQIAVCALGLLSIAANNIHAVAPSAVITQATASCVRAYARALRSLRRCVSRSSLTAASNPGGRQMAERIESPHRTTVNGKPSADTHTHSIPKTHSGSFTTHRDKSHSIKISSVTAERQQQAGLKRCVYRHLLLSCCMIPDRRFMIHRTTDSKHVRPD